MTSTDLRADCARCAALCCVALAFDRSALFGLDKPAGEPCPHLEACGRCRIHAERAQRGFGGCVGYDCLGAGQRVTEDLFGGRTWLREPGLLAPMAEAFLTVTRAHRLLQLLHLAEALPLSRRDRRRRAGLEAALVTAGADGAAVGALEADTRAFLHSLRECALSPPPAA